MILTPKRLTWEMYCDQINSPYSLLRTFEYQVIRGLKLKGNILDVGGGRSTGYNSLLDIEGTLMSVNIDESIQPTHIADINNGLPFESDIFDTVISFNTLEHIRNDEFALKEIYRVLKPGGKLFVLVPFLYRVHGSPFDFHRHTAYWWEQILISIGFRPETVVVDPLAWDDLGAGLSISEFWSLPGSPFPKTIRKLRKSLILLIGLIRHLLKWRHMSRIPEEFSFYANFALGYYITASK